MIPVETMISCLCLALALLGVGRVFWVMAGHRCDYADKIEDADPAIPYEYCVYPERYGPANLPAVRMDTHIELDGEDFGGQYVERGRLGRVSEHGAFTEREVHFDFMLAEVASDIRVEVVIYEVAQWGWPAGASAPDVENASVTIDGTEIAQWQFNGGGVCWRDLRIPADLIKPGVPFWMTFHFPDPVIVNHAERQGVGKKTTAIQFCSMRFSAA